MNQPTETLGTGEAEVAPADERPSESWLERGCKLVSEVALLAMLGVVALDIVTRSIFGFSYQLSEEVAGYMLVALTFFSLAACQVHGSFHRVQLIDSLLPPRGRLVAFIVFDLLTLAVVLVLAWQFARFEIASFRSGFVAPTLLATPLWLPQLAMVLGTVLFAASIVRTLAAHVGRLRALPSTGNT